MKHIMEEKKNNISRRDIIKGLATMPVAGALMYGWYRKRKYESLFKKAIQEEVKLDALNPVLNRKVSTDKQIRLGIIGTGGRGRALLKAAGFLQPEILDRYLEDASKNKTDKRFEEFVAQDDLNVVVNGVCDIYEVNAEKGLLASSNIHRNPSGGEMGKTPVRYTNYKELVFNRTCF